jgi:hypothetical protein
MVVRFENTITRLIVVIAMTISVVLFALSMPASNHEPRRSSPVRSKASPSEIPAVSTAPLVPHSGSERLPRQLSVI